MPPRRRNQPRPPRAGARPGALSGEIRTALGDEVARLERIEEPSARAQAVGDLFAALDTELAARAFLWLLQLVTWASGRFVTTAVCRRRSWTGMTTEQARKVRRASS
jgi:hypothetical protein